MKPVCKTCFRTEQRTCYKQCTETQWRTEQRCVTRPVTQCVMRECHFTVYKPCYETHCHQVAETHCKPVYETCYKNCHYTTTRQHCETCYKECVKHCHKPVCRSPLPQAVLPGRPQRLRDARPRVLQDGVPAGVRDALRECCQQVRRNVCETQMRNVCCTEWRCCVEQGCRNVVQVTCEPCCTMRTVARKVPVCCTETYVVRGKRRLVIDRGGECCYDPCICQCVRRRKLLPTIRLVRECDRCCTRQVTRYRTVCEQCPVTTYVRKCHVEQVRTPAARGSR